MTGFAAPLKAAPFRVFIAAALLCAASGCAVMELDAALPRALANHPDPETVAAALPAYLLVMDSLILEDGEDADLLAGGAKLYATYGAAFVESPERLLVLSERAFSYASRALAAEFPEAMDLPALPLERVEALLPGFEKGDLPLLGAYSASWLLWIKARADDWGAVAQIPKVERILERMVELDETFDAGSAHLYLGILRTLRPPALGGEPEKGRAHFEKAIVLSGGKNLAAKVEFARRYARMVLDRPLHDQLLNDVLAAPAEAEGFTLSNTLAKRQARELLRTADDYF